ncbi:MAG: HlyD family efflux transporter periplasmic adaptor subunit [Alphaproteobacteria bacterium]|nr:HlyD family efflux transporter periplasmic adaptor subunit [Alphaproteobacteria bacterium]
MNEIIGFFSALLSTIFPGLVVELDQSFSGYVEADYVYVAPTTTGRITRIAVVENQRVTDGAELFALEDDQQQAALQVAQSTLKALRAASENIRTGARKEELAVVRAQLSKAQANQTLATSDLTRDIKLMAKGVVASAKVDRDRATEASTRAQVSQLRAQLVLMELPARSAELSKAEANIQVAEAEVNAAKIRLAAQKPRAPVSGRIERVFYSTGEVATVGTPVVSILPDGARSVIFYISETRLAQFTIGDVLGLSCDGCPPGQLVVLQTIDSQPEFTPPIIYSRAERARLVFRAKARLPVGLVLNPGQPVSLKAIK